MYSLVLRLHVRTRYPVPGQKNLKMAVSGVAAQKNPISRLQEVFQQWKLPLPTYREAQGTYSEFGTEVTITTEAGGEGLIFYGKAKTKKVSKAAAAQAALDYIMAEQPSLLEPPVVEVDESVMMSERIWRKGGQANRQHEPAVDLSELARETDKLGYVQVGLDLGRMIQRIRQEQGLSQRELAARVNEKQAVIVEYELGRAIPNQQIVAKLERALGVHLRGEKAGQPKMFGRGRGRVM